MTQELDGHTVAASTPLARRGSLLALCRFEWPTKSSRSRENAATRGLGRDAHSGLERRLRLRRLPLRLWQIVVHRFDQPVGIGERSGAHVSSLVRRNSRIALWLFVISTEDGWKPRPSTVIETLPSASGAVAAVPVASSGCTRRGTRRLLLGSAHGAGS